MGCQSKVFLGNNLTFSVCTHDPDTGVLTDADAVPAYRIYKDETGTPILTGTMALLDTASTTGFYSEQIACTAANGFEDGKTYTIYVSAAVGGATGGVAFGFAAEDPAREKKMDLTGITGEAARSELNALRFLRNKWSISGTTLTVTKENDIDAAWTATVSTDATASPIVGSDPA